jgi:hypothetical protein
MSGAGERFLVIRGAALRVIGRLSFVETAAVPLYVVYRPHETNRLL